MSKPLASTRLLGAHCPKERVRPPGAGGPDDGPALLVIYRDQKINANIFWTKLFQNPSGHGRPRRKLWTSASRCAFSCGPAAGEKLFGPWSSGRNGQECPREIQTEMFMFMLFFSSLHLVCGVWPHSKYKKRKMRDKTKQTCLLQCT